MPLTWRDQAAHSAAGIYADAGAHLFDALAYALAPVQEVCAQLMIVSRAPGVAQPDSIDLATVMGRLRLDSGQPSAFADRKAGTVHTSMLASRVDQAYGRQDEMQVVGTEGALHISLSRGRHEHLHLLRPGNDMGGAAAAGRRQHRRAAGADPGDGGLRGCRGARPARSGSGSWFQRRPAY